MMRAVWLLTNVILIKELTFIPQPVEYILAGGGVKSIRNQIEQGPVHKEEVLFEYLSTDSHFKPFFSHSSGIIQYALKDTPQLTTGKRILKITPNASYGYMIFEQSNTYPDISVDYFICTDDESTGFAVQFYHTRSNIFFWKSSEDEINMHSSLSGKPVYLALTPCNTSAD
ncbi:hypothetical protein KIJ96_08935 [Pseudoalteromonas piscicida]|uniref:hypothetical protein n=1 Tax=Pseudoalteromonas TaxID=53246 RepID=UPI001BADD59F|nr:MULTISPECIES: hypothetical protein [Pseudoalteromonas]QUI72660.1 hypothetical protein GSF13_24410 [Pseudoalteromonas sp. M8]UDM59993.1 hypothetical protein KIJ96_08935 [Pseudoalteromonas piscicida]WJE08874.1 hypothetical protein QSH61_18770 [Pseudoalteromonas sp. JC3]